MQLDQIKRNYFQKSQTLIEETITDPNSGYCDVIINNFRDLP